MIANFAAGLYEPPPEYPFGDLTMCEWLVEAPEEVGIVAMARLVVQKGYENAFDNVVFARHYPYFKERTMTVCQRNFNSMDVAKRTIEEMIDFLNLGPYHMDPAALAEVAEYNGTHATSHDDGLRTRLRAYIEKFDIEQCNGDIAWLDNWWPC